MRKLLLLLLITTLSITIKAQTTAIPDANFEQALIDFGWDSGPIDGSVITANIDTVTLLHVSNKNISDLTGIEAFTALTNFQCIDNQINEINLSNNTALTVLYCYNNPLTCLNLKNGNNISISEFFGFLTGTTNLTCVEVDDVAYSTTNWEAVSYSTNCNNACSNSLTDINENNISNSLIYPNPTTGNLSIDLGEVITAMKVTLTNSLGQVILSKNYTSTNLINLELNAPTGIYFLQLETANGELITRKIIKE